jgi:hypothetical protein
VQKKRKYFEMHGLNINPKLEIDYESFQDENKILDNFLGLLVGWLVCWFVFKTSFAMKFSSKQGLLSMRGISAQNTDKQANKNDNSFCLSTVTPCRIGVPWPGPAVLNDDIVLVQLVLIHSGSG